MNKPHLIMPMGGAGSRFSKNGCIVPKPLIKINGYPFFYWAVMSILKFVDVQDLVFVILQQHINTFEIDKEIHRYFPEAQILALPQLLPGPVFSCLAAIRLIKDDNPIIINDCDHMFKCSEINEIFIKGAFEMDGGLLTFESNETQFSYVQYDERGTIIGTIEKQVVSNHAICGAYIFRNAELFINISEEYIENCPYKECFLSGMYNIMCQKGMLIKEYFLDFHVDFGTPEEYAAAKESKLFFELAPWREGKSSNEHQELRRSFGMQNFTV